MQHHQNMHATLTEQLLDVPEDWRRTRQQPWLAGRGKVLLSDSGQNAAEKEKIAENPDEFSAV